MRHMLFGVLVGLFICPLFAATFVIDKAHSSIEFAVPHLGLVPVKGRFSKFDGVAYYDDKAKKVTSVRIKIDVDSINTGNDDRDAHLRNKDFFYVRDDLYEIVEKNRYIEFNAKNFPVVTQEKTLRGELQILKTKREVALKAKIKGMFKKGKLVRAGVMAEGKINRNDFGLTWQKPTSGLKEKLAGKLVGDNVTMIVNLSFKRKQ